MKRVRPTAWAVMVMLLGSCMYTSSWRAPDPGPRQENPMSLSLDTLPTRLGPRPRTTPTNPHTQLDQNAPVALQKAVADYMFGLSCQHFGWDLEKRVRARILEQHHGELPLGQAIVVPTHDSQVPWLISAPTMRVPMPVAETAHAFLAFRALLLAAQQHNADHPETPIQRVACPGLGTGEGRMAPPVCATQMRYAWSVVFEGHRERLGGLAGAVRNHLRLLGQPEP